MSACRWGLGMMACLLCVACNKEPTSVAPAAKQSKQSYQDRLARVQPANAPSAQSPAQTAGARIEGMIEIAKKVPYPVKLWAGFVGKDGKGKPASPGVGFAIESSQNNETQWQTCETWKPLLATLNFDAKKGWTYKHEGLPAGTYLVYARWGEHYFDAKWVTVKDAAATVQAPLKIDPDLAGKLEIQLPMSKAQTLVAYVPLDEEGKVPLSDMQIQNFYEAKVMAKEPKVTLDTVRAGKYRILAFPSGSKPVSGDVEVKAGSTAQIDLNEKN